MYFTRYVLPSSIALQPSLSRNDNDDDHNK